MKKLFISLIMLSHYAVLAQINPGIFGGTDDARNPWQTVKDPDAVITYHNPVIPGFYSDPSVCRVGDDYYLISSTFEYFPGVPIFHSKDLVNWEQIGHCIHRREQFPEGLNIFAATLRYHEGTFYMITTDVRKTGNFYVTATDPAGPWSDPVPIAAKGIDPDLFFDNDGRSYVITSTFRLYEIDLNTGKLLDEGRKVWNGTGGRYAEGPHIYKKDGYYYLLAAEGGTEEAHSVTIARSYNIWGPYTENPANPILAHANAAGQGKPIQGVGHADMIEAHDGSWWMVFHGYRTIGGGIHHLLGRETCLAPVSWPINGWPVVNGNGTVDVDMFHPTLPIKPLMSKPDRVNFDNMDLSMEWNFIQLPNKDHYSLQKRKGSMAMKGSALTLGERGSPTFLGRRLQHMYFDATSVVDFESSQDNEEAGMVLLNNGSHFDLVVGRSGTERYVVVKLQFGSITYVSEKFTLKPGPVKLKISGEKTKFIFSCAQGNDEFKEIETVDSKFLSSETVGWFTGVYVGLYASGNGQDSDTWAYFDWFEYTDK